MIDLSVIIVCTNEWHVIGPCLKSIYEQTSGLSFEVIVVDNASTDGSVSNIGKNYPSVRLIVNERNLGFAAANNRGIQQASGRYVLLLNPDTEVLNGALQKTVAFMAANENASIVGCRLLYSSGALQPSARSFPTVGNIFFESTFLYLLFPRSRVFGRYYMTWFDYRTNLEVDWLCGAFLMIRRELIEAIGILDERFYIYTEEVDYCFRAREAGFHVWFFAGSEILHHWGGPRVTNKHLVYWIHRSQLLFLRKHLKGLRRVGCVVLKYSGMALRVPVYLVGGVMGLNRRMLWKAYSTSYALLRLTWESFRVPASSA